jgi:hypothetical protein
MSDRPPSLRVFGDNATGEVHGMTSNYLAIGSRYYTFPNVDLEDLPGFPDGYKVRDARGGWAQLIGPDGTVLDEEEHRVQG